MLTTADFGLHALVATDVLVWGTIGAWCRLG
jgi:hypothetical protein